ncbi:TIGR02391 family protein [Streptomyces sp. NBC_00090]|uniref:TIGR02391 family protein n=1 Tax=Streptomyces sp. NBC_00090 TaxID=2903619 RepID=UPI003864E832
MLIKGLGSMYRNPAAHDPRLHRPFSDEELLELLTTLSMVHRRRSCPGTELRDGPRTWGTTSGLGAVLPA